MTRRDAGREFPLAGIEKLCRLFGLSRDAFYKAENRVNKRCLQDALVLEKVQEIKKDLPLMGTEKVYEEIKPFLYEHGIKSDRRILRLKQ